MERLQTPAIEMPGTTTRAFIWLSDAMCLSHAQLEGASSVGPLLTQREPCRYRSYPRRWLMLVIVFLFCFYVQLLFATFAPIATPAAQYFDVGLTAINWLALVWTVLFLPCTALSAWAMHKYGLRTSLSVAACLLLVGSLIRAAVGFFDNVASPDSPAKPVKASGGAYTVVLIGTIVMAIAQPAALSCTTLTAASWFSERERNIANTVVRPCAACVDTTACLAVCTCPP